MVRPLILLTNDDGIASPGLAAAAAALCDLGELLIVAPATQQTGMGRASPAIAGGAVCEEVVNARGRELAAYSLMGSPAQAVAYAVLVLAPRQPDLVVSGINYGENPGTAVTGSVGAALQAAELGIPGLAVSLETKKIYHLEYGHDVDWSAAMHFAHCFARAILQEELPFDVDVLKIDVPAEATPATPWRVTRQSRQPYYTMFRVPDQQGDAGLVYLDYEVKPPWEKVERDSDIYVFAKERAVTVTPLSQDLTSRVDLMQLERLLGGRIMCETSA